MKSFFRGLFTFFVGLLVGGGLMALAFSWHVVQAEDGWHWVRNDWLGLADCYADVREWTANDWAENPELAHALVKAGKQDLIIQSSTSALLDRILIRE